jgi:Protein of unknown function (DUF1570)
MRRTLAVACGAALIVGGHAVAELVYFAKGGQAQLPATSEGDRVRLDTPDGPKTFPRADFATIVPGHRPLDEWRTRRDAALKEGNAEARFAAAWWALENGLTDEAIASLEELRPIASTPGPATRAIAAIDRLSPPCPDPDLNPLRMRLRPLRFRESRGPHVVLFHQHGEAEALERLDVIERVVKSFHIAFAAQGVELPGPGRRLVSMYFADRRDYVDFLRRVDGDAFADTQGYYHPVLRAVFAFDARSSDEQRTGRRAIANRKLAGESESELARRSLLLDLDWRTTDLGILAHETVHQLTSEGGLAPRFDDFPTWLHEGLAAQFEVVRGGRWAGFGRVNDRRLPDWRSIKPAPRLTPLLRDAGFGRGYRRDLYAESWALVYFLRKAHPREFLAFLDLLRTPTTESTVRPDRAFEAFRSAFGGDLAGLESEWRRFLADLKTPLEQGRPEVP